VSRIRGLDLTIHFNAVQDGLFYADPDPQKSDHWPTGLHSFRVSLHGTR
jgi:hypothetical protein